MEELRGRESGVSRRQPQRPRRERFTPSSFFLCSKNTVLGFHSPHE